MTDSTTTAPARPPVNRLMVFITVAMAMITMTIDTTIVATALDALQQGLDTTINWAAWTLTAYSFGFVLMLPVSGKLSERFGRRRVFLASTLVFTLASLLCALANNIFVLIALRALQAAGGAGFTPSATGIVVDYFGDARDRAVSLFGSIITTGAIIGPIFGGLFVAYGSWRGIFLVNVPIGLAVIALSLRYIPRDPPRPRARITDLDFLGIAMLSVVLFAGMLGVSNLGEKTLAPQSPAVWAPLLIAVVAAVAFLRHIRRSPQPFIAPRMIYGPDFGAVNLFNALVGGAALGIVSLIPLYAINRYGIDVLSSGTLLTAEGVAAVSMTVVAALALRRTGHRPPLYLGTGLMALALLLLAVPPPVGLSPYVWLASVTLVMGIGFGIINPASRNAGLQLEPEHASTLAALRTMCMYLGTIIAVSIAAAVISRAPEAGMAQAGFFVGAAILMLLLLRPVVHRIPEHHGAW